MPVRETVTIKFDGDAAGFLVASQAVRAELESLEREINQTNARLAKVQQDQAEGGGHIVRRQQAQAEALKDSLEAQRIAQLQAGREQLEAQRQTGRAGAALTAQAGREQLEAQRQTGRAGAALTAQAGREQLEAQRQTGRAGAALTAQAGREQLEAQRQTGRAGAALTAQAGREQLEAQRQTGRAGAALTAQAGREQLEAQRQTGRAGAALTAQAGREQLEAQRQTGRAGAALTAQAGREQLEAQRQTGRARAALTAQAGREQLLQLRRQRTSLGGIQKNLLAIVGSSASFLSNVGKASTTLAAILVVAGLIAAVFATLPTLLALAGSALGVLAGVYAIRYARSMEAAAISTGQAREQLELIQKVSGRIGFDIQQSADALKQATDTFLAATPENRSGFTLAQLGVDLIDAEGSARNTLDVLEDIQLAIDRFSRPQREDIIRRIFGTSSEEILRLLQGVQIQAARQQARTTERFLAPEEQRDLLELGNTFSALVGSIQAAIRGFIAENAESIGRLAQTITERVPAISAAFSSLFDERISRFATELPLQIERVRDVIQGLEPTWDRLVLRLRQAANLFTDLGLRGPAIVDLAAALLTLSASTALLVPLLRIGSLLLRSGAFITAAAKGAAAGGAVGTALLPGLGTALGAVAGGAVTGVAAYYAADFALGKLSETLETANTRLAERAGLQAELNQLQKEEGQAVLALVNREFASGSRLTNIRAEITALDEQIASLDRILQYEKDLNALSAESRIEQYQVERDALEGQNLEREEALEKEASQARARQEAEELLRSTSMTRFDTLRAIDAEYERLNQLLDIQIGQSEELSALQQLTLLNAQQRADIALVGIDPQAIRRIAERADQQIELRFKLALIPLQSSDPLGDVTEQFNRLFEAAERLRNQSPLTGFLKTLDPVRLREIEQLLRSSSFEKAAERLLATEEEFARQRERNARIAQVANSALQSFNQTLASTITDALFDVDDKSFQERIRDYFRNLTNQILNAILTELSQPLLKQIQLFGQGPQARDPEGNFTADLLKAALPGLIQAGSSAALGAPKRTAPVVQVNQQIFGSAEPRTTRAAGRVGGREGLREALSTQGGRELVSQAIEEEID